MSADPTTGLESAAGAVDVDGIQLRVAASGGDVATTVTRPEAGLVEVAVALTRPNPAAARLTLDWQAPLGDSIVYWQPDWGKRRHLPPEWSSSRTISMVRSAPVGALVNARDNNRLSWALSETLLRIEVRREGIREETARFRAACDIHVPAGAGDYRVVLRLDRRDIPYWDSLAAIARWWDRLLGREPDPGPGQARLPTYCTWYSMHQLVDADRVERAVQIAEPIGFGNVILDDGWQTSDGSRGYWHCGEWEAAPDKFRDLAAHVAAAHARRVGYLLWVAPPLLGRRSPLQSRFRGMLLGSLAAGDADILDPRFPAVRHYLTETCLRLLSTAGVDGLKLDFLDAWLVRDPPPARRHTDVEDIESAVLWWLEELSARLAAAKPGALLEFRQGYTGPRMLQWANVFRACDCPMDVVDNRTRTIDLRLLLAGRTVHSDPLLWDLDAPPEIAIEQLLGALYSVPQVSVDLDRLPPAQAETLRFWLSFWTEHAATLLDGQIQPSRPDLAYPVVRSVGRGETVATAYADMPLRLGDGDGPSAHVINATGRDSMVVEVAEPAIVTSICDCAGRAVAEGASRSGRQLARGLHRLAVPRSGLAHLRFPGG